MGTIFLSYSRADLEAATRLRVGLAAAGADVWQDIDRIRIGDNWMDELGRILEQCTGYLLLVGTGGVQRWVKVELQAAMQRHVATANRFPLYPLLLPGATAEDLPWFLRTFHTETLAAVPTEADFRCLAGLFSSQAEIPSEPTTAVAGVCPFPGLESYDEETARFYFGRQVETLEALSLLGRARDGAYRRWLQVEGPSGVGKSSLVKAGMLPAIRRGWIEAQGERAARDWRIAIMRPGSAPVDNLAAALGPALELAGGKPWLMGLAGELKRDPAALRYLLRERVSGKERFLLIVDQLEEAFTLIEEAKRIERVQFDALLAAALEDADGPFHLVTTVRSDFTLRFGELPRLESLLNRKAERYYLKRIDGNGLRDVVRTPARVAGITWDEPTLPERIVADAADEPSPLPLVSNLLRLLWQRREGNTLSARVHEELGGVGGALARSADGLLESLGSDGVRRARGLLLRLVSLGRDSQPTRRTVTRTTALAAAGGGPLAERVLSRLSGAADLHSPPNTTGVRLVAVSRRGAGDTKDAEDVVDLAHEALLTHWRSLEGWIRAERDQLEAEEALEETAWRWHQAGRPWFPGVPARAIRRRYRRARAPSELAQTYRRYVSLESGLRQGAIGLVLALIALGAAWMNKHELEVRHLWAMTLSRLPGGLYDVYEPEMIPIPRDRFAPDQLWMGSAVGDSEAFDNERQHRVRLQQPFAIGKYEVTWEQYARFAYATGRELPSDNGYGRGRRPVINVNWHDAMAYAEWLSEMTGKRYRLPTEAEWEYAARAGTLTSRFWGDDPKDGCVYANVADQSILQKFDVEIHDCNDGHIETAEADAQPFEPNPFGLYQMLGNVWEWTCSEYDKDYGGAEQRCKDKKDANGQRVVRGGSWFDRPAAVRSAIRVGNVPDIRYDFLGFRLAQDL